VITKSCSKRKDSALNNCILHVHIHQAIYAFFAGEALRFRFRFRSFFTSGTSYQSK